MDNSFLTGCASAFWHITSGVCRAVTACLGGGGRPATLPQDLVMAAHRRVARAQNELLALMERVRTGRLRVLGKRAVPVLAVPAFVERDVTRAVLPVGIVLPRRFGWLVHLVGYQAAGRASQLAHLLADPEMVALVRDVPQARRILGPLCRMLGVECAELRAVTRVRRVVASKNGAAVGGLVPEAAVLRASVLVRHDYRPSARWPRGVISRGSGRVTPA